MAEEEPKKRRFSGCLIGCGLALCLFFGLLIIRSWYDASFVRDERVNPVKDGAASLPGHLVEEVDLVIEKCSFTEQRDYKHQGRVRKRKAIVFEADVDQDGESDSIIYHLSRLNYTISGVTGADNWEKISTRGFSSPQSVGLDDIDGDGRIDAWVADPADNVMRIFYADEQGKPRWKQGIPLHPVPSSPENSSEEELPAKSPPRVAPVPWTQQVNWGRSIIAGVFLLGVLIYATGLLAVKIFPFLRGPFETEKRVKVVSSKPLEGSVHSLDDIEAVIKKHSSGTMRRRLGGGGSVIDNADQPGEHEIIHYEEDIDGDDKMDTIQCIGGMEVTVNVSGYEDAYRYSISSFPSYATAIGFNDVDGDGLTDLWIADPGDTIMRIYYGNENPDFYRRQHIGGLPCTHRDASKAAFYDVDKDGDLDIVIKMVHTDPIDGGVLRTEYSWIELEPKN